MAMTSSGGSGYRSYSYSVTETYTMEEAVEKASNGSLSAGEVYRQMAQTLQQEVDRLAKKSFFQPFSSLAMSEQMQVMGDLSREIKRIKEEREKPVSILQALQWAAEGTVDDVKVYDALPPELRKSIDMLAVALNPSGFKSSSREVRSQILQIVVQALTQQQEPETSGADHGFELHNRAIELKSNGDTARAVKLMREAENVLWEQAKMDNEPSPRLFSVYCNLSSALSHLGDWSDDAASLKSAISAADDGLALIDKSAERQEFYRSVLIHNRGHAGWRLGELLHDHTILNRGRADIILAGEAFAALHNAEAIKENADMRMRADAALAKIQSSSKSHKLFKWIGM